MDSTERILQNYEGDVQKAIKELGINDTTLLKKIQSAGKNLQQLQSKFDNLRKRL